MDERDHQSRAATRYKAVDSRARKREHEGDRHQVEDLARIAFEYLRTGKIQQRHKEHRAEQTHRALESAVRRFKESERFDAEHARHDMQCGNNQQRVPFRSQPPSERKEPEKREDRGYAEQKVQGMFSDKLHFSLLFIFRRAQSHR